MLCGLCTCTFICSLARVAMIPDTARLVYMLVSNLQIAGAYTRPLMMRNGSFFVETEQDVNVVDIQTHSMFVDIRIRTDRDAQLACSPPASSLSDYTLEQLAVLSHNQCFAGISVIDYDIVGYKGQPVCNRLHCYDWAPTSAVRGNNQWRIQTEFSKGGWVELGVTKDEHGQAAYVEHWATIAGTRDGPFLVLRGTDGERSAMLVVAGTMFGYISDRAQTLIDEPVDGAEFGTGTAEMVAVEVSKASANPHEAAGCRARIEAMLDMECTVGHIIHTGDIGSSWIVERSTFPWMRHTDWIETADGQPRVVEVDMAAGVAIVTTSSGTEHWEVFENVGVDEAVARRLFGRAAGSKSQQSSKL